MKSGCVCLCAGWGHGGICLGDATTNVTVVSPVVGPVRIACCEPCSRAIVAESKRRVRERDR